MPSQIEPQRIPVKVYRTSDRFTVAAPMPGVEPEDIQVDVMNGSVVLHADLRATLKDEKEVLTDEWNPGPYRREVELPVAVDGELANVTYQNGVLVVVLPVAERTRLARLNLESVGRAHGERVASHGHPVRPTTRAEHDAAKATGAGKERPPGVRPAHAERPAP